MWCQGHQVLLFPPVPLARVGGRRLGYYFIFDSCFEWCRGRPLIMGGVYTFPFATVSSWIVIYFRAWDFLGSTVVFFSWDGLADRDFIFLIFVSCGVEDTS